jgi:serine protease
MSKHGVSSMRRLALAMAFAFAGPAIAGQAKVTPAIAGETVQSFLVTMAPATAGSPARVARSAFPAHGTRVRYERSLAVGVDLYRVDGAGMSVDQANQAMADIASEPGVLAVEPDILMHALSSNDPRLPEQWSLHDARVGSDITKAWSLSRGKGVVVAVLDTGITRHPDLDAQVLPGYDFISTPAIARDGDGRDANAADEGDAYGGYPSSWHGTHVAGTIAAVTDNAVGVAGVAPDARILPVRVLGKGGGYMSDIVDAMVWAAGGAVAGTPLNPNPARVINLSLGGPGACSTAMAAAVRRANALGATVVVAAGNDSQNAGNASPASCPGVVSVAASGRDGALAWYSNHGDSVALTAPGGSNRGIAKDNVLSTLNTGSIDPAQPTYAFYAGTSMAAPHVAGVAALMLAARPLLTPADVREFLVDTTRPMPVRCQEACGSGLLDAAAAVQAVIDER